MKPKKMLLLLVFTLLFCVIFVACDEAKPNDPQETTPNSSQEATAHQHSWSEWVTVKDATCAEEGLKEKTCRCGEKETRSIDKIAHTEAIIAAVAPTCTKTGLTEGKHCSVCNKVLVNQKTVDALGHIPGPGATCATPNKCTVCNEILEAINSHTPGPAATCTTSQNCLVCNTELIAALGHTDAIDAAVSPTRTETGLTEGKHCSVCNEILVEQEVVPATGSIGLAYQLNDSGTGYIVTGIGTCEDSDVYIPEIYNGLPVTEIARRAFYKCLSITEITIPSTVNVIGEQPLFKAENLHTVYYNSTYVPKDKPFHLSHITTIVFGGKYVPGSILSDHTYVEQVILSNSVTSIEHYAFSGCKKLSTIDIPDSVTSIGFYAFYDCTGLLSVDIGNGVTSIDDSAFSNCTGLTTVIIGDGVTSLRSAFNYKPNLTTVKLGNNVTSIGYSAFIGCSSLTSITLPESVTSIDAYAFKNCSSLTSITLPKNMTSIGACAFEGCSSLTSIIIPDGVSVINNYTFADCICLESVSIPDSVTGLDFCAFENCVGLTSINIPDSVTVIGGGAFSGCTGLTSVVIPDSVETIGNYAFQDCTNLCSITIPNSVTYIGEYAFGNCTSLISIEIPGSITYLSQHLFDNCTNLIYVIMGNGVESIDWGAFMGCSNLKSIVLPDSLKGVSSYAFWDCKKLKNVYYIGTEAEWNAIKLYTDGNGSLTSAAIHYNYDPTQKPDDDTPTTETRYSIYVDDEYFINTDENYRYLVAEKHNYYQLYIKDNETGEILTYGKDSLTCVSSNNSAISVGPSGTMVIYQEGVVNISLIQNGIVLDRMAVFGCVENSRITNYSATKDSELFKNGFAPNNRLKVFNYQSVFVADSSYEGGGYYKVTFDVYNDVPTYFSVGVFDKNGNLIQQRLINGYSDGMVGEMMDTFINFGDWFNGNLITGETEIGQAKTSITLEVPLGGCVDFLTLNNSYYMVFANTLCGIVMGAMETSKDWVKLVEIASVDLDVDKIKFGEALVAKIAKNLNLSTDEVIKEVIDLVVDAEDYAALATDVMAYIWNSEITMENLFITLAECSMSELPALRDEMIDGSIDLVLTVIPPANILKKLTDATVSSLQYVIVLKDMAAMATNNNDFLVILYPTEQIP